MSKRPDLTNEKNKNALKFDRKCDWEMAVILKIGGMICIRSRFQNSMLTTTLIKIMLSSQHRISFNDIICIGKESQRMGKVGVKKWFTI
jgi:hypothetical protein